MTNRETMSQRDSTDNIPIISSNASRSANICWTILEAQIVSNKSIATCEILATVFFVPVSSRANRNLLSQDPNDVVKFLVAVISHEMKTSLPHCPQAQNHETLES